MLSEEEASRTLAPWLRERGYELVTLPERIRRRFGGEPRPGKHCGAYFFRSARPAGPPAGTCSPGGKIITKERRAPEAAS